MGSKYTSAFWRLFKRFVFLKGFFIIKLLKSVQSYYFLKCFFFEFIKHAEHLIKKKMLFPCSNARDVSVKFYITYIITSLFLSQLGYLLSILIIPWSNFYQLHALVLTLGTLDIKIFGEMNGKLTSKNSFWKWISCAEGENDEMGIPSSGDRSRSNNPIIKA